jgi:hypothetical protein
VPLFEQLTPVLDAMLATSPPLDTDLTFVFCILADLVRYCGNGLFHYVERFKLREMLVHYALVGSYNVRGTACFAMGVLALYGGPQHASVYARKLSLYCKIAGDKAPDFFLQKTTNRVCSATAGND